MTEIDNVPVWDGRSRGHYEVWYLTFNHRESGTGYWIRYTLESPHAEHGEPYCQLWFARFDKHNPQNTFAINRMFPIGQLVIDDDPVSVRVGDAVLTHGSAVGSLAGDGHTASWDLRWRPAPRTHRQLPPVMYKRGGLGDTTVLTPNVDVPVRGTVTVDGAVYDLTGDPGAQTHLWGRKHAHAWAWGHCNAFDGHAGAALEALTVRLKRRGRVLPPLTIFALYLDGEIHRWNQFAHTLRARGHYGTARYAFAGRSRAVRIEGEYTCRPEDMVVAEYADPDGEPSFCANTEVADLRVTVWKKRGVFGRWREHARLVAPGTGHFEIGGRTRDPAVVKDHTTV